ncbi:MAG: TonB-dependent receptor [Holophaga sp.]|nr:TonB-dependent receptor [Holophaga sp.]
MAHPTRQLSALMLALIASPAVLIGQGATTSALMGVVRDPQGAPLAGATVRLTSAALIGGEKVMKTSANGSYRMPALPPGLYRVVVEAPSFSPMSGIEILELGRTSTLNWKFQAVAAATVEVVAQAKDVEGAGATVTQNYQVDAISQLPTASRSLSDILNLTPGVNGGSAWGGTSRGANAYLMDGINVGDPSGGTQWIYTNLDWFDEVQVGGVGAPAEFGGFTGGFINTVVKRGGNEFSGVVSSYYDTSSWQARSSNKDWNWTASDKDVPATKNWDASVNVGGPILKDRLWFFISAERENQETTNIGTSLPRQVKSNRFLGKLTWQALPSATLEGLIEYDTRNIEHKYTNESWGVYEPEAGGFQESPSQYATITWTQSIGQNMVMTLKANGFKGEYNVLPYNGETPPLEIDGNLYFNNVDLIEYNKRTRTSFSATLDYFKTGLLSSGDSHALRIGMEREQASSETLQRNPGGYLLKAWSDLGDGLSPFITRYAQTYDPANIREWLDRSTIFVQDTWTVNDRLTLRPGLRFEQFKIRPKGGVELWNTNTLAPRMGLTYALTADQRHLLRMHWGRFFSPADASFVDRAIPGAYPHILRYSWASGTVFTDVHNPPVNLVGTTPSDRGGESSRIDPNAKQPYIDETTVSYEAKLGQKWSLSATWIYRKWKQSLIREDAQLVLDPTSHFIFDPITTRQIAISDYLNYQDQDWYIHNSEKAKRAYYAWTVAVDRKLADNWSLTASYTRARAYGNASNIRAGDSTFENPNNLINADGILGGVADNEIKIRGSYQVPVLNTRITPTFTSLNGLRWTRTVYVDFYDPDVNPFGNFSGNIFAEPRGAEKYPTLNYFDLRISQAFPLSKKVKLEAYLDVFNVFNWGTTVTYQTRSNANPLPDRVPMAGGPSEINKDYLKPSTAQTPRNLRIGLRLNF